jgi:toluene monooxygenase electron transfer component
LREPETDQKGQHYRIVLANTDVSFVQGSDDTLLSSMLRSGIGMPYECNAGGCGSCKFTLIDGSVSSDIESPPGLRRSDIRKNVGLACISRATGDCTISARLDDAYEPKIRPTRDVATFVSRVPLTHDMWEFTFRTESPASFLPGQYAKVFVPGVIGPRSYSMSNTANDDGVWQFQIKRVPNGETTAVLFGDDLEGTGFSIDAPYSIAHLDTESTRPVVCIAGGSGLAPMVSILRGLSAAEPRDVAPLLYYGARTVSDIVAPAYFSDIPDFDIDQQYTPVVSEPESAPEYEGAAGFVHEHLAIALPDDCSAIDFYLAGPPPMVDAVRRHLVLDRKVPIEHLHYDRFF